MIQRDPADVIDAILKHVPTEMTDLRARLVVVRNDSFYDPPEYKYPSWRALRFVLETSLSTPPKADWEIKISDIVEGRVAVHEDPPYPNGPMSDEAAIRDRAEAIFKARADEQCLITQQLCQERVKRAEQERDRHKQAYDVAMQGWGQCSQERDAAQADVERLQVQLAGCGVAAGGWAKGENDCKPGDYGHSASFDAVKQLRAEVERLRQAEREGSDVRECLRKQLEKAGARVRDYGTELQGRREAMRAVIAEWDSPRQKPSHQGALDFIKWIREQASKD